MAQRQWSESAGRIVRASRRRKGWTQEELARRGKTKQPRVSSVENGDASDLSEQALRDLLAALNLQLEKVLAQAARAQPTLRYCFNARCPTNLPYAVGNELVFKPMFVETAERRCRYCGAESLVGACPDCGRSVDLGTHCHHCGGAYVGPAEPPELGDDSLEAWARRRRENNQELIHIPDPIRLRHGGKGNES